MHTWDPALADDLLELRLLGPLGKPPTPEDLQQLHPDQFKRTLRCAKCRGAGHNARQCSA